MPRQTTTTKKTLDKDLDEALEDAKRSKVIGPFSDVKKGLKELKNNKNSNLG